MTTKIDKRNDYYITLDTETCNDLDNPIVYDVGLCVHNTSGKVFETKSLVIYDVFCGMKDLMKSAYYSNKIPQYEKEIAEGSRKIVSYFTARKILKDLCDKYEVKGIIAHNARFDYRSLTTTQRYLTKSKYRFFLPYGVPIFDTLKMARQVMENKPMYHKFCFDNGYITKNGKSQFTAEVLYRWITRNTDFIESHTALEDVLIEKEIFAYCMRNKGKNGIKMLCFE